MMGVRANTAVKPKCVNGAFQCPVSSHTGRLAVNVYAGSSFAPILNPIFSLFYKWPSCLSGLD